ncbi:MAG: orotidine-5'-phosphate decarboxylase [Candidatus Margulisbacteria bacterium]|jgi:orotidine 5'-phosphate decarboxylase subfamily 2|nr:orotidine-5'-phosphate decarboxylase [Candidatus Margulisiibacteriota bacterium]
MSFLRTLDQAVKTNHSSLCVGLDVDLSQLPAKYLSSDDPILTFNMAVIEATADLVCAYKPNAAFYEMYGLYGISSLIRTIDYIHTRTKVPVILDAKRGDVGHSSAAYAKAAFDSFKADAVTVNPYMGHDSVKPFLDYRDKGVFVLCLTSNAGSKDFESAGGQEPLYLSVAKHVKEWNHYGNCGLVVGATKPEELKEITKITGDLPVLIPGVGAQGGSLEAAVRDGGKRPIINASRSIIYAADPKAEAKKLRDEINKWRK